MSSPYSIEYYLQNEASAAEQFDKAQWRVGVDRNKFFERLALLSAGAVVLSVSLLSTVFGKTAIHGTAFLFAGWAAFVLSLMTSLFRELKSQPYMLEVYFSHYQSMAADKKTFLYTRAVAGQRVVDEPQEDGSVRRTEPDALKREAQEMREDAKRRKGHADRLMKTMRTLELIAINSFWVGVLLLRSRAATKADISLAVG
jgi:hypothetical protein